MKLSNEVECIELKGGNAYLIHAEQNVLIDTGLPFRKNALLSAIRRTLGENAHIDSILLTHHDVDHIGNLSAVQMALGGIAYISQLDLPYALGQKKRPGIKHIIEKMIRLDVSSDIQPFSLFDDANIKVVPMPGHTPGHTVFQYKEYLFIGDLFKIIDGHTACMKKE